MFFKLQRQGLAPRTMRVGARTLISVEAAAELRSKQVERLREALRAHQVTGKEVAEALAPLCPINLELAHAAGNAKMWLDGIIVAVETAVARATVYVGAVVAGTVPIVAQPQPAKPEPKPLPPVERRRLYLHAHSRWIEPDGSTRTAHQWSQADLPLQVA